MNDAHSPSDGDPQTLVADVSRILAQRKKLAAKVTEDAANQSHALYDAEKKSLEFERQREELRETKAKNQASEDNLELRKHYAHRAIDLAQTAVWFWVCMFVAVGIGNAAMGLPILSDQALVTLTAGATVNVLAAFLGVIRGLFPRETRPKRTRRAVRR